MRAYFKRVLTLIIGGVVFLGIPFLFGEFGLLIFSWIPALYAMAYLDGEDI